MVKNPHPIFIQSCIYFKVKVCSKHRNPSSILVQRHLHVQFWSISIKFDCLTSKIIWRSHPILRSRSGQNMKWLKILHQYLFWATFVWNFGAFQGISIFRPLRSFGGHTLFVGENKIKKMLKILHTIIVQGYLHVKSWSISRNFDSFTSEVIWRSHPIWRSRWGQNKNWLKILP